MIPTVDDVKSDALIYRFGDLFNPPGITNFWGCVQSHTDISGLSGINFPPFGTGNAVTNGLFINDIYFPATARPIIFTWYPDRIERQSEYEGLYIKTITTLAVNEMAVLQELVIENRSGSTRRCKVRLGFQGAITHDVGKWAAFLPPSENDNRLDVDRKNNALIFSARHSTACLIQGTSPRPDRLTEHGPEYDIQLKTSTVFRCHYVAVIAGRRETARKVFKRLLLCVPEAIERARAEWNAELAAVFTPGNDRYSGHLPELHTRDKDILRLYFNGILGVISFKRDNPFSVYGRAYDTLMPRYWQTVTFIWDYSLSSLVHALLDPAVMKKYMQQWMLMDIHHHFGSEYLTGQAVGPWYAVNDYALCVLMHDYLRWSGDWDWLQSIPVDISTGRSGKKPVSDFLDRFARSWKFFRSSNGLADYGDINNLLECVSTYIHEVASLNGANIFNMRLAAEVFERLGQQEKSNQYLQEVQQLLARVQELYVPGGGYWNSRHPGKKTVAVRHCYDFITILRTMADDLGDTQKEEMAAFFKRELQTETWMRALSAGDPNAMFSIRPDHQWNGAYPAWPAQAVSGLYKLGQTELAFQWLKGLSRSANQGPFGQAHFVENVLSCTNGAALKAPPDFPFMCDWAVSGCGCWADIIIESIFGVKATLSKGIDARPQFGDFDPKAELHNLHYQGKLYKVTRKGLIL